MPVEKVAACSWSSGKDSCFACYKAINEGYKIKYLVNFISEEFKRVSFHGVWFQLVAMQAGALGIPLLQRKVPAGKYEETFRGALRYLRSEGVSCLIAGDIFLLDCRNWVEDIVQDEGLKVIEPLWGVPSQQILIEFVKAGFKAIVTATQAELLDEKWVGRIVNHEFIKELDEKKTVDLCGENGEYHTFVFDGPIFKKMIKITKSEKVKRDNYWFMDIQEYHSAEKGENV